MQYTAQTVIGIEDIAIKEIEELTRAKAKTLLPGRLLFECNEKKANELIYITKSLTRVCLFLSRFKFKTLEDIETEVKKIKFNIKETFAVRCSRQGEHPFVSKDAEAAIGGIIDAKVNLDNPDTIVFADIINNECIISILLTRKELQKREYRVKPNPQSINPCVAYAMVRLINWKKTESLLDPFCRDGVIAIEAALYACNIPRGNFSDDKIEAIDKKIKRDELNIFAYDASMPNIRSTEINSKLASVNKQITFSRTELDWLDTKFSKESVDKIITLLPSSHDEKELAKSYKEFMYQAEYILKKKGRIALAVLKPDILKKHLGNFKITEERQIKVGEFKYWLLVLGKTQKTNSSK
ncbi:MAG: hypothetical protein KJ955_03045 [Nanoarchaeota archaeon]|nr:hypothetical protein [Nanoarchaeota archaeon]